MLPNGGVITRYQRFPVVAGYKFSDPSVDPVTIKAVGAGGTAVLAAVLYAAQYRVYKRMLSFQPQAVRESFSESFRPQPTPLTFQALWKGLGPSASMATFRAFRRQHGVAVLSGAISLLVCGLLCGHFQPVIESLVVPYQPPPEVPQKQR